MVVGLIDTLAYTCMYIYGRHAGCACVCVCVCVGVGVWVWVWVWVWGVCVCVCVCVGGWVCVCVCAHCKLWLNEALVVCDVAYEVMKDFAPSSYCD